MKVTLMGMPGTGKSTYLVALYDQLNQALAGSPAKLTRQPAQRVYLDALHSAWLAGEQVDHTPASNGELIELDVAFGATEVKLSVPDIAGESFSQIIERRVVNERVAELVRDCDLLLVFVHPGNQRPRVTISQAKRVAEQLGEKYEPQEQAEFDPLKVPGEVHLIELLQWAASERMVSGPLKIGFVISAWDRCHLPTPTRWLNAKMPMLSSYLKGQADLFEVAVWGVSAQGGDYEDKPDLADALSSDRAYLVDAGGVRSADMSQPLRWAASDDQ